MGNQTDIPHSEAERAKQVGYQDLVEEGLGELDADEAERAGRICPSSSNGEPGKSIFCAIWFKLLLAACMISSGLSFYLTQSESIAKTMRQAELELRKHFGPDYKELVDALKSETE